MVLPSVSTWLWGHPCMSIPSLVGVNPLQTTWFERGTVSGRVALLLRSAEIQPLFGRFVRLELFPITWFATATGWAATRRTTQTMAKSFVWVLSGAGPGTAPNRSLGRCSTVTKIFPKCWEPVKLESNARGL